VAAGIGDNRSAIRAALERLLCRTNDDAFLIIEEAGGVVEPFSRDDVLANGTVAITGGKGVFAWIREESRKAYDW